MHILKIIHGYPPAYNAGSEVYSQSICDELSKNHRVSVFTREENLYAPCFSIRIEKRNDNLSLYLVNNPQGKDGYRHQQMDDKFEELLLEIKPEIAHIGHLNHLSTGLVDILNKHKIPIVFTLHDFWLMCPRGQFLTRSIGKDNNFQVCFKQENEKCASDCYRVYFSGNSDEEDLDITSWSEWVARRMLETQKIREKVNLFIAPSRYLMSRFTNEFGLTEEQIMFLDYGFPSNYLYPPKNKNNTVFTFGYIGTHIPSKGLNILIEAFKQVKEKAELKIYGRPIGQSTNALKQLALSSKNKIIFEHEYLNCNLVDEVFANVDCIVVPSIWGENSPLVIHEAQECKIPVITADFGGMKEYVKHKVNGLLFKHRDIDSLAKQLTYAVENQSEMRQYGEKGYLFSDDGHVPNITEQCDLLMDIYKQQLQ